MKTNFSKTLRRTLVGLAFGAISAVAAAASTLPVSADLTINASVGNTVTSTVFPLTASLTSIGAGQEYTFASSNLITFLSSGFAQTMTGTLGVDISAGQVVLSYSGTAQGVGLSFSLTNLDFGTPAMIVDSASQTGSTGVVSGVNATAAVGFTDNSISGGFNLFGFQPGTSMTQTISFTTAGVTPPPPPPPTVPLPASLPLLAAGLGLFGIVSRRRKGAAS